MRHSIAVKFIAVFLAALALLSAIGSGAAIVGLVATDLYENSVEELYNESMQSTRQNFAVNLAHRYASLELGNLPDQYLNDYYGLNWLYETFQYGYFYYTIRNEHGDVVESTMAEAPEGGTRYEMAVTDIRYRSLVEILTNEVLPAMEPSTPPESTDDITTPPESTEPSTIPENTDTTEVPETQSESEPTAAPDATEATTEPDAGSGAPADDAEPEAGASEPTGSTEATVPMDGDLMKASEEPELIYDSYFDYEQEKMVEFTFTYEDLPPYTVDLYLLPGAMPEEYAWTILRQVWTYRNELFYFLGGSLLIFAIFAVYLCSAAGRKPGREELRAGGFNCIPLDLYLTGGGTAIFFIIFLGAHAAYYMLMETPKIMVPFVVLAGYACCLIFVGFCFACAAQLKTPGGYWWRNTLCIRFIFLCVRFTKWLERFLGTKFFPALGQMLIALWQFTRKAVVDTCHGTDKFLRWLIPVFLVKLVKDLWRFTVKAVMWLYRILSRFFRWIFQKLHRFLSLLPLTWQWLLVGLIMIFFLFGFPAAPVFRVILAICIIVYGAHCFGILLESTKRMGKGDLETKVDDQLLLGSFKEFAGDLNALADVAAIAAQKQLKSERMKTELITNVSHDIKTPLTSIINYVDLLQKPHTEEEQEVYLEVLSRQSLQLKKLIEDLMEMSKASTGNMTVDITSVNAGEAINQALGEFSDKLEKIQLTPVFRQPEEAIYMKADGRLVWRVLSNLLSNAYKYALPGTRLYIDLMALEGKVIISMKNISREELNVSAEELLERFVRGDVSRNTEGSGLGLNIAKSLMELQKGQLQLLVDGDLFKVTLVFPAA